MLMYSLKIYLDLRHMKNIKMSGSINGTKEYHGFLKSHGGNGEPTDNIDHVCKPIHFKSGHAQWPTCNWKEEGCCNGGDLPGIIRIGNTIHFQDYEWYEGLEDGELKEEALKEKAILEGSWGHENKKGMNLCAWLKQCFRNYHELDHKLLTMLQKYWWGIKDEEESSDDAWSHYSPIDEWKDYEHTTYIETDVNSNQNTYNYVCQMFKDHAGTTNDDDAVQADQGWFDNHEPMENNDDDIGDLGDYLIPNEGPYYVNEEEERSKERRCKLLGIPYMKPPTCKSEKFEVVKYSFGPAEEYVAIKEYEYGIRFRTEENVSRVYQEIL
ncbi:hypothetical protein Tco_1225171 [Tanacetum coccineum]